MIMSYSVKMKNKRVLKNIEILNLLANCKKCMRTNIIKSGSKDLIASICECIDNVLSNNAKLTPQDRQILYKYKSPLRKIIKKSSLEKKKKILIQKGGFLQFLIPIAISAISSLIGDAIT